MEVEDAPTVDLYDGARGPASPTLAQLEAQYASLFSNACTFRLGRERCLLKPEDLVEVNGVTMRITAVKEYDESSFTITAEDFFGGYSIVRNGA